MPGAGEQRYAWLEAALGEGGEIVTASRRLARDLRQVYGERRLAAGHEAWPTPAIRPWDAWLNALLDEAGDGAGIPQRLATQAAALLWERCLRRAADLDVLDPHGLVRQARRSWQRLADWCVGADELARFAATADERHFAAAATRYRRELARNGWVDAALLPELVAERLSNGGLSVPGRITLAGFDRPTPAVRRIMEALEARGCRVSAAPAAPHAPAPRVRRCADGDAELRAAGAWARERLAAEAAARIAIVYPGLEQDAARAERLVREGFAPGWQAAGDRHADALQVSYGRRLADYPLIARAVLWLRWTAHGLTSREVSLLLRAPFPGHAAIDGCSRLELELRRLPDRRWTAAGLAEALRHHYGGEAGDDADAWLARADTIAAAGFANAPEQPPAVWASRMHELLEAIGWPGGRRSGRGLDSREFQVVNRWRELLNEFARIEPVRPRLGFTEALARVARAAGEAVFQPESEAGRVQLLGTLEAVGLELDHAWIGNLHALQWPPPSHPLPLVSRALQRRAGMPDATPSDTLGFARRTLSRLVASAPSVVLSWPAAENDVPLAPSPLLAGYGPAQPDGPADPGWHAAVLGAADALESPARDEVPRVQPDERIPGGAYTVQQQVTEPFTAFARGRLGARELDPIAPGLSARTVGQVVHAALQRLLAPRPSSAELAGWLAAERASRIEQAVDAALAPQLAHADAVLRRLVALERTRLKSLLDRFLDAETARRPFTVDRVETDLRFVAHGVALRLRADRIDRLADGSLLVIDYKTGAAASLLDRAGEPVDLQLVVYACALEEAIGGLALVNLGGSRIVYRGTGSSVEWGTLEPGAWAARLDAWRERVDAAIAELADGDVRVDVTRSHDEARPLSLLSRVAELRPWHEL